jgi:phosphoribosyl 1,2-cyclic phosphodiesterase
MKSDSYIRFLGTAGARFVVAKQLRSSAGTFLHLKGHNIILDPGPGTLVECARSKPLIDVHNLEAIILTHAHIDHTNDANILIDAMTSGGLERRGFLFAPDDCINGENSILLRYLQTYLENIVVLRANQSYSIEDLSFSTSLRHCHQVETYGLIFDVYGRRISFLPDTKYFPELTNSYVNSDVLVLNVVRSVPDETRDVMHLCIRDVANILTQLKPSKAIITHFGMTMIKTNPFKVADELSKMIGIEVTAAFDGMTVEL